MDTPSLLLLSEPELLTYLHTSPAGLSPERLSSLTASGQKNTFMIRSTSPVTILLRQFKSPFTLLLIAAAIFSLFIGEYIDVGMIGLFLFLNAAIGFVQEYKSEKISALLNRHFSPQTQVVRGGQIQLLSTSDIFPGDIIVLEPGNIVPADVILLNNDSLSVDESVITGESRPVARGGKMQRLVFAGSSISAGISRAVVVSTGENTQWGSLAKLSSSTIRPSLYEKQLARVSSLILRLVLVSLVGIFVIHILIRGEQDLWQLALFSIALAISVVPEALPVVTTFAFAKGALKLSRQHVVVKRLSSVEDLGEIQVLCTDKTGTLTENKLAVESELQVNADLWPLAYLSIPREKHADQVNSFSDAITKYWQDTGHPAATAKIISRRPFDPVSLLDETSLETGGKTYQILKGAPEAVFSTLASDHKSYLKWVDAAGRRGCRVLAVASRTGRPVTDLHGFTLNGLISFSDPVKKSAAAAVRKAEALGVDIRVLTGDHKEVALAVASEIGLIKSPSEVITGVDWDSATPAQKDTYITQVQVFSRINPQQKFDIIAALQKKFPVGYMGDGINDAPALKLANVALVVPGATDVARSAADIVLLQKDLAVIISGIEEGRIIFANTFKYITATLSANFGNFIALVVASFVLPVLPMLPLQILLVNLLSDFPMISMAGDAVEPSSVKKPAMLLGRPLLITAVCFGLISSFFDLLTFGLFARLAPAALRTYWFMESILSELVFIFSARTSRLAFLPPAPSRTMILLALVAGAVTVILPFTAAGQLLFSFIRPQVSQIVLVLGLVAAYFICTETAKHYLRRLAA